MKIGPSHLFDTPNTNVEIQKEQEEHSISKEEEKKFSLSRKHDREKNYVEASFLDLTVRSELSWINDSIYSGIIDKKLKVLSIVNRSNKKNIFDWTDEESKKRITELAKYIMEKEPQSSFVKRNGNIDEIFITHSTLSNFKDEMERIFELTVDSKELNAQFYTKACAAIQLLSFLVSLRLYKEIKTNNIVYPLFLPSKEEAIKDFHSLQTFTPNKDIISFCARIGNKAVNYFSKKERIKAETYHNQSPFVLWNDINTELAGSFRKYFKGYYEYPYKKRSYIKPGIKGVDNKEISILLESNHIVSQFPPTTFFCLINFLKQNHHFTFNSEGGYVLDPCGGWGGRAVACFAHPDIKYYTAVEPNSELTAIYKDMRDLYAPNKKLITISKKIEDVELSELKYTNYDLAFTSPPYKDLEIYTTSQRDYANIDQWNYLLFKLLKTSDSVKPGGFLVLNVSNSLATDVNNVYNQNNQLHKFANLKTLATVYATTHGKRKSAGKDLLGAEVFMIFRREAGTDLRFSLETPSMSMNAIDKSQRDHTTFFRNVDNYFIPRLGHNDIDDTKENKMLELPFLELSDDVEEAIEVEEYHGVMSDNSNATKQKKSNVPAVIKRKRQDDEGSLNGDNKTNKGDIKLPARKRARRAAPPSPTPIDEELMLSLAELNRPEYEIPVLSPSYDADAMVIEKSTEHLPMSNANKRKRLDEDLNETIDIIVPKKKKARRNPLETDTVEGKKSKDKIIYDFNRKTKEQAKEKIKLQLEEYNKRNDEEPVITKEPLLIRFKTSLIRSALAESFESEKNQTAIVAKVVF